MYQYRLWFSVFHQIDLAPERPRTQTSSRPNGLAPEYYLFWYRFQNYHQGRTWTAIGISPWSRLCPFRNLSIYKSIQMFTVKTFQRTLSIFEGSSNMIWTFDPNTIYYAMARSRYAVMHYLYDTEGLWSVITVVLFIAHSSLEQWIIIKFLCNKNVKTTEILERLPQQFGENTFSRTQML